MRPRKNHGYVIVTKQRTSGRRTVAQVSFPLIRHSSLTLFLFPFLALSPRHLLLSFLPFSVSFRSPVSHCLTVAFLPIRSLSLSCLSCLLLQQVVSLCIFSTSPLFSLLLAKSQRSSVSSWKKRKKREKWKVAAEVTWSSAHEFPVTFRDTRRARGSC